MSADLLNLPWQIQAALASGYAGYAIAYTGIRDGHKTIDVAFITLVFSLIATGMIVVLSEYGVLASASGALVAASMAGVAWRRWGRSIARRLLRRTDVAWSDDDPSALASLSDNTRYHVTQIAVLVDDGRWLRCDNTAAFVHAPYGPCLIGPSGDVALYPTHIQTSDGSLTELRSVNDSHFGDRIAYVPAHRIRQINIRHQKR